MKHKINLFKKKFKGSIQGWNIFKSTEKWKELTFVNKLGSYKKTQRKPQIKTTTHLAIFKLCTWKLESILVFYMYHTWNC